jgi:hypothetical protein
MITFIAMVFVLFLGLCMASGLIGFLFELAGKRRKP